VFTYILPIADVVSIAVLSLAVYFPRHRRADLTLSFLAINVGVLAVSTALSSASVNAGLGLGLFGVLAIIRLRSSELSQTEVAYYFTALSLGVIGGLGADMGWYAVGMMAAVVVVVAVADSSLLFRGYAHEIVVLDRALTRDDELNAALEELFDARIVAASRVKLDLINDSCVVDVRYVKRGQK
jgi:hypothetical protein